MLESMLLEPMLLELVDVGLTVRFDVIGVFVIGVVNIKDLTMSTWARPEKVGHSFSFKGPPAPGRNCEINGFRWCSDLSRHLSQGTAGSTAVPLRSCQCKIHRGAVATPPRHPATPNMRFGDWACDSVTNSPPTRPVAPRDTCHKGRQSGVTENRCTITGCRFGRGVLLWDKDFSDARKCITSGFAKGELIPFFRMEAR